MGYVYSDGYKAGYRQDMGFDFYDFSNIFDFKDLYKYLGYAENCEKELDRLKANILKYKNDLTERAKTICEVQTKNILIFERRTDYGTKKIYYDLLVEKVPDVPKLIYQVYYEDGQEVINKSKLGYRHAVIENIYKKVFLGTERADAIREFKRLKKQYVGIEIFSFTSENKGGGC